MRIIAELDSDMEKDLIVLNSLVENIKCALKDIQKVLNFKTNSEHRLNELNQKKEDCERKINTINSTLNVDKIYKYQLRDRLSIVPFFDFKTKRKLIKQFKTIKENRHDLKEWRAKAQAELEECERLIERRKSIRAHESLSSYLNSLVSNLILYINEYREYRKDFYAYHGLSIPTINLSDLIRRTNGKEIEVIDFNFPDFTFVPFMDEDIDEEIVDEINEDIDEEIVDEIDEEIDDEIETAELV